MLLWITETPVLDNESDELIIRTPSQIRNISPNGPSFVVIDSRSAIPEVMEWASKRHLATLWWKPNIEVPKAHCRVDFAECCANEFIPLISYIYHRSGVIGVSLSELESLINLYNKAQVFYIQNDTAPLFNRQCWSFGYLIHRDSGASIEDFGRLVELGRSSFNIEELVNLIIPSGGPNLLLTFSKS